MPQNPIPTPKNDIPWQEMDDILLLAMHNRGLIDILEDVYGEHIRLDGNTIENLTKVSALLEAILRNAKRLEKRCLKALHPSETKA